MNYLTFEVKEGREMYVVPVKSKVEISQNFVAFSEWLNDYLSMVAKIRI